MKVIICLEKFSDWLEAYSIFCHFDGIESAKVLYIEGERNNETAVKGMFEEFKSRLPFSYVGTPDRPRFIEHIEKEIALAQKGDILAAPFIRYRPIWATVPQARKKGIITVHLSESFPDSFNRLGYRLGFRLVTGRNIVGIVKQLLLTPAHYVYATLHKPDYCFYNMAPAVQNDFVRHTVKAYVPKVEQSKRDYLQSLTGGEKRPLLISGFGYDWRKMATYLGAEKYIATSKNREIILDGKIIPLDYYICAEEVMLSGCASSIIGYSSTAMCWAYLLGGIPITCYESSKLNEQYGFLNGILTRRTMKRCGLTLLPECKEMIQD